MPKYAFLRAAYKAKSLPKPGLSVEPSPSCSNLQQAISPAFKDFQWYPEHRPGHAPKYVRTDLDRAFSVSSKIVVNELINKSIESKRKGENKNNSKAKVKKSQAKGNNATNINDPTKPPPKTTTRNVSPAVDVPNTSENQDLSHSSEESYKNSQTSEESAEEFDFSEAISLPLEYPEIYSWVETCFSGIY